MCGPCFSVDFFLSLSFQFSFLFFPLFSFWIVTLWFIFMPLPCAQYIFEILAWRDALFVFDTRMDFRLEQESRKRYSIFEIKSISYRI